MGKTNLYTIVTNDEYEIPIKCDLRVSEAAKFFKTDENNIRRMIIRPLKKSKYKVVISGYVKYDNREYEKVKGIKNEGEDGYYKAFMEKWDDVIYRLQSSGVDLGRIVIVGRRTKHDGAVSK